MSALEKIATQATVEEYLEGERKSETRHEYVAGDIYDMAGASRTHNRIAGKIHTTLQNAFRGKRCEAFITDMKVRIRTRGETLFYYPDVFVSCDPRDTDDYFSDYPSVIFEVLSPDTKRLDEVAALTCDDERRLAQRLPRLDDPRDPFVVHQEAAPRIW